MNDHTNPSDELADMAATIQAVSAEGAGAWFPRFMSGVQQQLGELANDRTFVIVLLATPGIGPVMQLGHAAHLPAEVEETVAIGLLRAAAEMLEGGAQYRRVDVQTEHAAEDDS